MRMILGMVVLALVAGCAAPVTQRVAVGSSARANEELTQRRIAVKTAFDLELRLWRVGYGVLRGAAGECGEKVRPALGFRAIQSTDIPARDRELIASAIGADEKRRVYEVYRGSAAEAGGLKVGDVITASSADWPGVNESREAAARRLPQNVPVMVEILRGDVTMSLRMTPDLVCDYPLQVGPGQEVNAYADGKLIVVSRGMMRFAAEDRELAMVVAHELGHNTMGHLDKKRTNATVGALVDILAAAYGVNTQSAFMKAGAHAYSQDFEAEADYVGLYYLARAGYATAGAADFWRRMAAEHPGNIKANHSATHPATAERFLALEEVNRELTLKKESGAELTPNTVK